MLVLSRKRNEAITVGADITFTVLQIKGDVVRIGVDAPPAVPVHRSEILPLLAEQQPAAE